jgi:hypothetical protein
MSRQVNAGCAEKYLISAANVGLSIEGLRFGDSWHYERSAIQKNLTISLFHSVQLLLLFEYSMPSQLPDDFIDRPGAAFHAATSVPLPFDGAAMRQFDSAVAP